MKKITPPALIMLCSNERQSFRDAARWMNDTISGSRVVEAPQAGHASIRERIAFAIAQLRAFLD